MESKEKQPLIVTISGDRPIHEVAKDLRDAGFGVDQVLEFTGTITGSADPGLSERFQKIVGVADVSPEHPPFNVGPPGSPVS